MFADIALAHRLHRQNRQFFAGLASAARAIGIADPVLDLESSIAFFAGDGSSLTQASGELSDDDLDKIAKFFRGRATNWEAILTPFDGPEALQRVIAWGGKPEGWESVLWRPVEELRSCEEEPAIRIEEVVGENAARSKIAQRGFFGEEPSEAALLLTRIMDRADNVRRYLAFWNDEPAGVASMTAGDGIAFLGGGTTLPEFRGRGIQAALIQRRLEDAQGCELAIVGASPGSTSHRNAERAGFRVAWSQLSLRVPS